MFALDTAGNSQHSQDSHFDLSKDLHLKIPLDSIVDLNLLKLRVQKELAVFRDAKLLEFSLLNANAKDLASQSSNFNDYLTELCSS
ncbi:hypothetical protein HK096_004822, partial [Nowakowskiella sp. JEL0078]